MKDQNNDSTSVLARFGRDKRTRTVKATAERVERRPRSQRDAADSEQPRSEGYRPKRSSYNPHFTADNRPKFEHAEHPEHPERTRYGYYDEERPRTSGEREFRPRTSHKPDERFGSRMQDEERPRRTYGGKTHGEGGAPRSYGSHSEGAKRPYGEKSRGGKPAFRSGYGEHGAGSRNTKPYGRTSVRRDDSRPASYPKYDPARQTGAIRLNRFLAQSGICSRREADDFITAGVVSVNGKIVTELGTKVLPTDEVRFNDSRVQGEKKVYLVLNKPKGYVTSLDDPHADKTVMDLVKGACEERIYPVGRLDKNSVGLLLFTNDGDLTKQLTHPSYRKKKIYQVSLDKPLTRADMDRIAEGVTLEDGEIYADEISYVKENKQEVGIEIHSGRNRIVRRIFESLGYTVTKLDRVYYAGLTKKNLKRGAWRFLTREEVERLKSGQYE